MPIAEKRPLHFALDLPTSDKREGDPVVEVVKELLGRLQQLVTLTSNGAPVDIDGFIVRNYRTAREQRYEVAKGGYFTAADKPIGGQPMKSKRRTGNG